MEGSDVECYQSVNLTSGCQNMLNPKFWTSSLQVLSGTSISSTPYNVTVTDVYSIDSSTGMY